MPPCGVGDTRSCPRSCSSRPAWERPRTPWTPPARPTRYGAGRYCVPWTAHDATDATTAAGRHLHWSPPYAKARESALISTCSTVTRCAVCQDIGVSRWSSPNWMPHCRGLSAKRWARFRGGAPDVHRVDHMGIAPPRRRRRRGTGVVTLPEGSSKPAMGKARMVPRSGNCSAAALRTADPRVVFGAAPHSEGRTPPCR